VEQLRAQEFVTPSEEPAAPSRREFLKLAGAGAAFLAAGCARKPVEKILPYGKAPEDMQPGNPVYYASTCGECPAGCGLLVKTREGRPIKLEGNPDHPANRGALCARGQASVINLYDPDRLRGPVTVDRATGKTSAAGWGPVDKRVTMALRKARDGGGRVVLLTGTVASPTTRALIHDFVAAFPAAEHVAYDAVSNDAAARAGEATYGDRSLPRYRLDRADVLVTLGADPLGTFGDTVEQGRDFAKRRRPESGAMSRVIAVESILTLTGTNADRRVRVRPDQLYPFAMALASRLGAGGAGYTPEAVEAAADLPSGTIASIADELAQARGRSLVMADPNAAPAAHAVALQIAVNLINSALGNDGVTVDASRASGAVHGSGEEMLRLVERMRAGEIQALIVYGTNPAYSLPTAVGFADALKRVPFVASMADRADETARLADVVAPSTHYLESWGDHEPRQGVLSLMQPAIAPLYDVRSFQDSLLAWARYLGRGPLAETAGSYHEYLRERWRTQVYPGAGAAAPFDLFWEGALRTGVIAREENADRTASGRSPRAGGLGGSLPVAATPENGALTLVLYPSATLGDGRSGNNAWLQELPDPVSKICWDNFAAISPHRARQLGVRDYEMKADVVTVDVGHGRFDIPVHVQPGLHDDVVAIMLGYGRTGAGTVGNRVGQNAFALAEATGGQVGLAGIPVRVSRAGTVVPIACVQGHQYTEGRPIIYETTLSEYQRDPSAGNEGGELLPSMWSRHKYPGHKWGMAIDLNACTGCSACMLACMVENNVPAVGKAQVLRGREMHWLRIDRYYSGPAEDPETVHQPMLCQHCENAPCETVCPVLATVHSSEGLNLQVYNRCVGTRYCSNNCPYKVRRFNWFDYTDKPKSLRLVLNPDVTVRTKGIMEKCTFCVQRIRDAREHSKVLGVPIQEGDLQTACQQTCPSQAITFGDQNDPKSRVADMARNKRSYHVLADLNTLPSIAYMTKVRNREEESA
ncbi:MAG TPA: 4Fe-4S dicluster domain-containing protein, partial [Candidatus Eisenbacteria bacterium]|nr:4Fe-4S dicluster domain-containing protein [Candidatus Eisenbacteria bacterium]